MARDERTAFSSLSPQSLISRRWPTSARTGLTNACMLVRTERGKFDQVAKNLQQIREVRRVFAVLGRYDVVVDMEAADSGQLARAVVKANHLAGVVYTETLPEVEA